MSYLYGLTHNNVPYEIFVNLLFFFFFFFAEGFNMTKSTADKAQFEEATYSVGSAPRFIRWVGVESDPGVCV